MIAGSGARERPPATGLSYRDDDGIVHKHQHGDSV
jgi:hypothetical protein